MTRLRFAHQDGGHLNLSQLRKAFLTYLISRKLRGSFIFRLDNVMRSEEDGMTTNLFALEDLDWLGLIADESPLNPNPGLSPYVQNERLDIYQRYIDALLAVGAAYKRVPPKEKGSPLGAFRPATYFKMRALGETKINDLRIGKVTDDKLNLNDWIIAGSNGVPSEEFAAIIDDHLMGISHVVFELTDLPNLGRYVALNRALNWQLPTFIHLSIGKINRDFDEKILTILKKNGYLPEAICSYLYRLDVDDNKADYRMNMEQIVNSFEIDKIRTEHQFFDEKVLKKINSVFIKTMKSSDYTAFMRPFIQPFISEEYSDDFLLKLALVFQNQISYGREIEEFIAPFLLQDPDFTPREQQIISNPQAQSVLSSFYERLANCDDDLTNVASLIGEAQKKTGIAGKAFYQPLRLLLTRMEKGPELEEIIKFLGKAETLRRLSQDKD